jgi:23S rRNA (cytosine1962-C5)-methyltransferase
MYWHFNSTPGRLKLIGGFLSKLQIQLHRNLRRTVMRGHPWIYRESIVKPPQTATAQLCQIFDGKNEPLAWAMYDPHSPLCLRILSLDKKPPPFDVFEKRFEEALRIRRSVVNAETDSFRLFNGEGDLLPGLICDIYGSIAVLQFDGQGPNEFWDKQRIASWLINSGGFKTVIEKFRRHSLGGIQKLAGDDCANVVIATENGVRFKVELEKGQKTGFFLDQRDNRKYIQSISRGYSVLNLFSYSGGFSVYAGLGGALRVASLDVAQGAIDLAVENWKLNGLNPDNHQGICVDVFEYLKSGQEMWDHVIVDPPSMGHSEDQKTRAQSKYIELFTAAIRRVKPHGQLSVSSCSSHISFEDFFEIINEAVSAARRRGQILRVSGQGPDHPFPHGCHELRYLKFVHLFLN